MMKKPVNLSSCENSGMAGDVEIKQQDEISTIVDLRSCGWKLRAISRELGISRNTVKKYIRNEGAQEYRKPERPSVLDGLSDWLRSVFSNTTVTRRRYEKGSILLTSNRSVSEWGDVFGDNVVATAILDRLLHHSTVVTIRGDSYRLLEKRRSGLIRKTGEATPKE